MKRKRLINLILLVLAIALIACLPIGGLYLYVKQLPATYGASYYAALPLKYDRLTQIESPKIVVIGGSSVAFGIDSKLVEEELGMPCVNFGLYAAFGLKPMLDLSENAISEGDIVIIAPELSSQMYSDYVGYDFLIEALEGRSDMALALGTSYFRGFISELDDYISESSRLRNNGGIKVSGVYALSSFDQYGDIVYPREKNIMDNGFSKDNLSELNDSLVTDDLVTMVNKYVAKMRKKGAQVYWGFCPINEKSMQEVSSNEYSLLADTLAARLDCEIIASLSDHLLPAGYFYDSNFHTNDAGVIANTVLLINDIKRVTGNMTLTAVKVPAPIATESEALIGSGSTAYYTYNILPTGVVITGLTSEGISCDKLIVEEDIDNYHVTSIGANAFEGSLATTITLPESITTLSGELFANAPNLTHVYLNSTSLPAVGSNLLDNANSNVKICVPADLLGNYVTDYFWGQYESRIIKQ